MKRDYKLYIQDISKCITQIENYLRGVSQSQFENNQQLQDAVLRRLEIIGEASRNIPRALKEKNKFIPWFEMSQLRDFITHSYFEVSVSRLWKTLKEKLPEIKNNLKKIKLV